VHTPVFLVRCLPYRGGLADQLPLSIPARLTLKEVPRDSSGSSSPVVIIVPQPDGNLHGPLQRANTSRYAKSRKTREKPRAFIATQTESRLPSTKHLESHLDAVASKRGQPRGHGCPCASASTMHARRSQQARLSWTAHVTYIWKPKSKQASIIEDDKHFLCTSPSVLADLVVGLSSPVPAYLGTYVEPNRKPQDLNKHLTITVRGTIARLTKPAHLP